MIKITRNIIISTLVALLAACGGGGDSSGSTSSTSSTSGASVNALKNGVYAGTWAASDNTNGVLVALIANNKAYSLSDANVRTSIALSGSAGNVTGQGSYYYTDGNLVQSGSAAATGSLANNTLTLSVTNNSGLVNDVVLSRQVISDETASFDKLKGNYQNLAQTSTVTISDIGAISGSDDDGCVYAGDASIPSASVNIYEINLTVTGCVYSGDYTGIASVDSADGSIGIMYGNSTRLAGEDLYK